MNICLHNGTCIYIIPPHTIFFTDQMKPVKSLSKKYTSYVHELLYLNNLLIIDQLDSSVSVIPTFFHDDEPYLPDSIKELIVNDDTYVFESSKPLNELMLLHNQNITDANNHIYIFANSLGISAELLEYMINLLNQEDEVLITTITEDKRLTAFGCNNSGKKFLKTFLSKKQNFDSLQKKVCEIDILYYELNEQHTFENLEDFRALYKVLSTKQSRAFFTEQINEKLNDVFIEYKEIL